MRRVSGSHAATVPGGLSANEKGEIGNANQGTETATDLCQDRVGMFQEGPDPHRVPGYLSGYLYSTPLLAL